MEEVSSVHCQSILYRDLCALWILSNVTNFGVFFHINLKREKMRGWQGLISDNRNGLVSWTFLQH